MTTKQTQTETKIKAAVVSLLAEKPFDALTISDITRRARINRGTFYLHYLDKYDLMLAYENDLYTALEQQCQQLSTTMTPASLTTDGAVSYPVVAQMTDLISRNFALFRALIGPNGDPRFEPRCRHIFQTAISDAMFRLKGTRRLTTKIPSVYAWEIIISGIFDLIKCWLRQPKPESAAAITDIIMQTRVMAPCDVLGLPPTK